MNTYEKRYYTVYQKNEDITFIMCELYENNNVISLEVVGFHFGEPYEYSFDFIGRPKATFDY